MDGDQGDALWFVNMSYRMTSFVNYDASLPALDVGASERCRAEWPGHPRHDLSNDFIRSRQTTAQGLF